MKKLLSIALIAAPLLAFSTPASAEHWDVIGFKLKEGCSVAKYTAIVKDFNVWGAEHGYQAKVGWPLQSDNFEVNYWVGTSANAAAFGAAWDAWRDALSDPKTTAAKLQARFSECSENVVRNSYDAY